jgi:hypothetical protein
MTVGPLPPSVYWRRRGMVAAAVLLVVLLLGMCATRGEGSGGGSGQVPTSQSSPSGDGDPNAANLPGANDGGADSGTGTSTSQHPDVSEPAADDGGAGTGPQPSPEPKKPACSDSAIDVEPALDRPQYRVGEQPRMRLTIRNVSSQSCWRDVGADFQELRVMLGGQRIWSSDDCAPVHGWDMREFAANQTVSFTLVWAGTTSKPKCPAPRVQARSGTYQLYARLGTEMSGPLDFKIVK